MQHPDDLLFGGFAGSHDPQRVADIVVPGLVTLATMCLGSYLDGSFQGTHTIVFRFGLVFCCMSAFNKVK